MTSVTLISFMGAQPHGRDYPETEYRFASGTQRTRCYFGQALLEELRGDHESGPDRWIVIGTSTSAWDQLRFCVAPQSPRHRDAEDASTDALLASSERSPIAGDPLMRLGVLLSEELGVVVRLLSTTDSGDDIFTALHTELPTGTEVEVDITHGFRTMPLHTMIALGALRWVKGIRVRGIHYGKLLPATPGDPSRGEAHRLESMSLMAQATPALASLHLRGDLREIADVLAADRSAGRAVPALKDTQRLEDLMQYGTSAHRIAQAKGLLHAAGDAPYQVAPEFMRACVQGTLTALQELGASAGSRGLVERSQAAQKRSDYLRATALAHEALLLVAIDTGGLRQRLADQGAHHAGSYYERLNELARVALATLCDDPNAPRLGVGGRTLTARHALHTLRRCRNSAMHAASGRDTPGQPETLDALLNQDQLDRLISWAHRMHDFILHSALNAAGDPPP